MKFISVIYMSRHNFWCMTRGDSWHLNFQLQKVDWEPSGRQNWGQMMEFWKILYIHFIRDPKGITYVRLILKIESDAKMAVPNGVEGIYFSTLSLCCDGWLTSFISYFAHVKKCQQMLAGLLEWCLITVILTRNTQIVTNDVFLYQFYSKDGVIPEPIIQY